MNLSIQKDRLLRGAAALTLVAVATSPLAAMTADEVIAKHVEAKGGKEAWQAVHSIKMTGDFTAFSKVKPFTLHRKRDNLYHVDHWLGDKLLVVGYDGETAWWENTFFQEGAVKLQEGPDLTVIMRDVEFETPMLGYPENGLEITLSDETDIEGEPAIALSIDRGDESEETWYLDPDTYLELARVSPGSDFGRPMPQTTFFDDHREVAGVVMPHFTETQWYTRDRVFEVHNVEVNLEIDDALFRMPAPLGMETLQHIAGEWNVAVLSKSSPREPEFAESERTSTIDGMLGGAYFQERYVDQDGIDVIRSVTYDRFRKQYVITEANSQTSYLDIQHADGFDDEGVLVASNVESGTTLDMFGMNISMRTAISDVTSDGFKLTRSMSVDGGENWAEIEKLTYTRAE